MAGPSEVSFTKRAMITMSGPVKKIAIDATVTFSARQTRSDRRRGRGHISIRAWKRMVNGVSVGAETPAGAITRLGMPQDRLTDTDTLKP